MTPERERIVRVWHAELARLSGPAAVARRAFLGELLEEIDSLRIQVSALEKDSAELNALHIAGVDNWDGYSRAFEEEGE